MKLLPTFNYCSLQQLIVVFAVTTIYQCGIGNETVTAAEIEVFRLNEILDLPEGFSLAGSQRTRYENLANSIRIGTSRSDELVAYQTILNGSYTRGSFTARLEFMDARQSLADRASILGTGTVNTLDILQANIRWQFTLGNTEHNLIAGRYTTNLGSRRLMARNRFRNTINAFEGLELDSRWQSGFRLRSFIARPVIRLPGNLEAFLENDHEADEGSNASRLAGIHATIPGIVEGLIAEIYVIDLNEKDTSRFQTRNRDFYTAGMRFVYNPGPGKPDFEIESVFQKGSQHETAAAIDNFSQDHEAMFNYAMVGYSFSDRYRSRILMEIDHATGDKNPLDGGSERFDGLYGVTVPAFGPGSLYGVFTRANIISPGVRFFTNPTSAINFMAVYRHFWLASDTDSWGRTRHRDTTGDTDRRVGEALELRLRWAVIPASLDLEISAVLLNSRSFVRDQTRYVHVATTFTF